MLYVNYTSIKNKVIVLKIKKLKSSKLRKKKIGERLQSYSSDRDKREW